MEDKIRILDSEIIYHSFINGACKIINSRKDLNKINVFPVQDGDTGNNLSSMMRTIIDESEKKQSVKETMESFSEAALKGARGNSGIIFAEYLYGLSTEIVDSSVVSINHYAKASLKAVDYAYRSIENPVEGTIITVMKEWGRALCEELEGTEGILTPMHQALERLNEALARTQYQLSELRKAKVVDAGAKGFSLFIHGVLEYFRTGKTCREEYEDDISDIEVFKDMREHDLGDLKYRYCTECMIEGKGLDDREIKGLIKSLGDSMIVAAGRNFARIHIHTDNPAEVFSRLYSMGKILQPKVDDMAKQRDVVLNRKYDIALVTDSIADLPAEFIEDEQIQIVNLNLLYDENSFIDRLTITPAMLLEYSREDSVLPTTSLPDVKQIENLFYYLQSYYSSVIVISVSGELSGTYGNFTKVAKRFSEKGFKISVVDSRQNSGAQGLLAVRAAGLVKDGFSHDDIIKDIENSIPLSKILVCVNTLDNMIKSGRLSTRAGKIGRIMGLKPIVTLDDRGRGDLETIALSSRGSIRKLRKHIRKVLSEYDIESYNIVHINNIEGAKEFEKIFTEIIGRKPDYIEETSSVVAVGAGEGAVALSYIKKKRE